jgi:hypothetical protein
MLDIKPATNSTYPKVGVPLLNQALCFNQSFCLVDSEVLRNRHLRVGKTLDRVYFMKKMFMNVIDNESRDPKNRIYLMVDDISEYMKIVKVLSQKYMKEHFNLKSPKFIYSLFGLLHPKLKENFMPNMLIRGNEESGSI